MVIASFATGWSGAIEQSQRGVLGPPAEFEPVKQALTDAGFEPIQAEITMEPSTTVALAGSDAEAMLKLADALEDLDDVQGVYANFDIPDEVLAELAS